MEQWIKEGKLALRWTRLSCRAFRDNAVRLQLFALAYNLANFLRSLALPDPIAQFRIGPADLLPWTDQRFSVSAPGCHQIEMISQSATNQRTNACSVVIAR